MNVKPISLMDKLRDATWEQHKKLEKQAFNQALLAGQLPQAAYLAQLQQYFLILQSLEQALNRSEHPSLTQVWQADLQKTHLLQEDLAFFQALQNFPTLSASQDFIAWIKRLEHAENGLGLLGVLYVFEGSTLGATVLLPLIRQTYHLEQQGCAFYTAYSVATREHWGLFRDRMNQALPNVQQHETVTQAAQQCFAQIAQLLGQIWENTARP